MTPSDQRPLGSRFPAALRVSKSLSLSRALSDYAYRMSDKVRDSGKDFGTLSAAGNDDPYGIWSDGTTMWVAGLTDRKLYAYRMSDKARDSARDFDTPLAAGNKDPLGIWSDGTTMWSPIS